jgi:hypothetical protein
MSAFELSPHLNTLWVESNLEPVIKQFLPKLQQFIIDCDFYQIIKNWNKFFNIYHKRIKWILDRQNHKHILWYSSRASKILSHWLWICFKDMNKEILIIVNMKDRNNWNIWRLRNAFLKLISIVSKVWSL